MTPRAPRIPSDLQKLLNAELSSGERALYAAQPDWRAQWLQHLIFFLFGLGWMSIAGPFALLVGAEALGVSLPGFKAGGMGQGMAIFFSLFMIPFLLIGLACVSAPFLAIRKSARTVHAITDQRLINLSDGGKPGVESYNLQTINFVKRRDLKDGFGTLEIGYGVEKDADGDPRPLKLDWPGIPDAKRAEALIREYAKWAR